MVEERRRKIMDINKYLNENIDKNNIYCDTNDFVIIRKTAIENGQISITPVQMPHDERLEMLGTMVDIVEDWLTEKGVTIDNPEKEQDEIACNIYGSDYDYLAGNFEELLINCGLIEQEKK